MFPPIRANENRGSTGSSGQAAEAPLEAWEARGAGEETAAGGDI